MVEYISSNCTIEFDPSFGVDDTVGTYVTNYLIAALGIPFGILFLARVYACCGCLVRQHAPTKATPPLSTPQNTTLFWQALYFLLAGAGYGAAGLQHQFYHTVDDLPYALQWGAVILVGLSLVPLQLSVTESWEDESRRVIILSRLVYVGIVVVVVVLTFVFETLMAVGVYNFVVLACTGVYHIRCFKRSGCHIMHYISATGNALVMAGLAVQVLLSPVCGPYEGYKNCFRDCPLPTDPLRFNHNALFHAMVAIGLVFQAIGWWWLPVGDDRSSDDKGKQNASELIDDSFSND